MKNRVIILGYIRSIHRAKMVVDGGGIAPTIMENHGKILMVMENESASEGNIGKKQDDS